MLRALGANATISAEPSASAEISPGAIAACVLFPLAILCMICISQRKESCQG